MGAGSLVLTDAEMPGLLREGTALTRCAGTCKRRPQQPRFEPQTCFVGPLV